MRKNLCLCAVFILLMGNLYCQDEITNIKTLILTNDPINNRDITLLRKINMGIPGGDNWLVESIYSTPYRNSALLIYVINGGNIIKKMTLGTNYDLSEHTDFDIMEDIPGMRIGEGSSVIYDYNDDGFDEIFRYAFGGSNYIVWIAGYDLEIKEIVDYARIPFKIIDRERGPSPAEFIIYKGMKGFKVYLFSYDVAGGPDWIPDPNPKNGKWFFYTWNEEKREFVEIEEVEEGGIESVWPIVVKEDIVERVWKPDEQKVAELPFVEDNQHEETPAFAPADSGKNSGFSLYIAVTAGIVVLAAATFFIVAKSKKKALK